MMRLTQEETILIILHVATTKQTGNRNAAMFALMGLEGMKPKEVRNLLKHATFPELHSITQHLVSQWRKQRAALETNNPWLFCSIHEQKSHNRIDDAYLRRILIEANKEVGIDKLVSPGQLHMSYTKRQEVREMFGVDLG